MTSSTVDALPELIAPTLGPTSLKQRPWGGRRLAQIRAQNLPPDAPADAIWGESWEFSTLEGSESRALGRYLGELLGGPLPFLAKLIDTEQALSVQVHPEDDPSTGQLGKEEAWIILDAAPGAAVLAGLREGVDHAELERRAQAAWSNAEADGPALVEALQRIEVERGDVILVPGRTLHAIQGGILLAEIQQPTDCTYRLFDYGSDRQIHPEAALATTDPHAQPGLWRRASSTSGERLAGRHVKLEVHAGADSLDLSHPGAPALLVCVDGPIELRCGEMSETLASGDLRLWTRERLSAELGVGTQLVVGHIPTV